jgi:hypothetical protein
VSPYVPGSQFAGSSIDAPAGQKLPGLHWSQLLAPSDCWYLPATHSSQRPMPSLGAMLPGEHCVRVVDWSGQKWPRLHELHAAALPALVAPEYVPARQGIGALAPCSQYEPRSQALHAVVPVWSCQLPGAHRAHRPILVFGATLPGRHACGWPRPPGHSKPTAHGRQSSLLVNVMLLLM